MERTHLERLEELSRQVNDKPSPSRLMLERLLARDSFLCSVCGAPSFANLLISFTSQFRALVVRQAPTTTC
jgi:hypothetical protein